MELLDSLGHGLHLGWLRPLGLNGELSGHQSFTNLFVLNGHLHGLNGD
jgi:hypothetical protein